MQTFGWKIKRDLNNMWETLTRGGGAKRDDEHGAGINMKRHLHFVLWSIFLFIGVCTGSWGVLFRLVLMITMFNFIVATPATRWFELDKRWQHPVLLVVGLLVMTMLIPINVHKSIVFPIVRVLGILWRCCEGVIVIDVAHYVHYRLITRANAVHRLRGWSMAARWYALHISLTVLCCSLAAIIFLTVNAGSDDREWASDGVDTSTVAFMVALLLLCTWASVNKGALIPAIVLLYAAMQCWSIRACLVHNADRDGFLTTFHFILLVGAVLYGVVQERSITLRTWTLAFTCGAPMGDYGALPMGESEASTDQVFEDVEAPASELQKDSLISGETSFSVEAADLVSQSKAEVTPLFHILLALAASSAVIVGDSLGDATNMTWMWAALQSVVLAVLGGTFAASVMSAYSHQQRVFASRHVS